MLREVLRLDCPLVEVTGGEPLLQETTVELLGRLCDEGRTTLLETNGTLDISTVDERVVRIVDIKCPSSGHADSFRWANLPCLRGGDEVKFVLADAGDYQVARDCVRRHGLAAKCAVIFSPVQGGEVFLAPSQLAEWILADKLPVRLGLQLHKIIWPEKDSGV